jgi:hypothetical protein
MAMDNFSSHNSPLLKGKQVNTTPDKQKKQKTLAYEATLTPQANTSDTETHNKTALLQINVVEEQHGLDKLSAVFSLLNQTFAAITILIDMHLAKTTLKIIMPYLPEEKIDKTVAQMKTAWLTNNMPIISKINIPWSIITNTEQHLQQNKNITNLEDMLKNSAEFGKNITTDAKLLTKYLSEKHNVTEYGHKNTATAEIYIVDRIATIATISDFNDSKYAYISYDKMCTYNFLQKNKDIKLPLQYFTLSTTKNDGAELFISRDNINEFSYFKVLDGMKAQNACLESFIKHFPGNFYMQSLNRTLLGCNNKQALAFGIRDEAYLAGQAFDDLSPKYDSDNLANTVTEITTTDKAKIMVETYPYLGKKCTYLSIKTPLKNKNNTTIGIIGFSLPITDSSDADNMQKSAAIHEAQSILENATSQG